MYPTKRNLDTIYFRVERDGKWKNLCYTDLTPEEQDSMTEGWTAQSWERFGRYMAGQLRRMGDELNLATTEKEEDE